MLLGGTFDPVHEGHVALAGSALRAGYDEVILLPVARSPHKVASPPAPALDRWAMCVLATLPEPRCRVSRIELERLPPSYSIDTVRHFARSRPDAAMWWAIGADNLAAIETWMGVRDFARMARFLVVPRADLVGPALDAAVAALPPWLRDAMDLLAMAPAPVSSTAVRECVRAGRDVRGMVPDPVATYLARYGLYRGSEVFT